MRTDAWRLGAPALLALALAGPVAAQDAETGWGTDEDGVPISGDGVDGEVTVTDCTGCEEYQPPAGGDGWEYEEGPPVLEEGGEPIYADGGDSGEEPVLESGGLPPGFCEDCEEDGEIVGEVLAEGSAARRAEIGESDFRGTSWQYMDARRVGKVAVGGDLCTSAEGFMAWMCGGQR